MLNVRSFWSFLWIWGITCKSYYIIRMYTCFWLKDSYRFKFFLKDLFAVNKTWVLSVNDQRWQRFVYKIAVYVAAIFGCLHAKLVLLNWKTTKSCGVTAIECQLYWKSIISTDLMVNEIWFNCIWNATNWSKCIAFYLFAHFSMKQTFHVGMIPFFNRWRKLELLRVWV